MLYIFTWNMVVDFNGCSNGCIGTDGGSGCGSDVLMVGRVWGERRKLKRRKEER